MGFVNDVRFFVFSARRNHPQVQFHNFVFSPNEFDRIRYPFFIIISSAQWFCKFKILIILLNKNVKIFLKFINKYRIIHCFLLILLQIYL